MSYLDLPPVNPPAAWAATGDPDKDRECGRCGGLIPALWRHFMRPCSCTYEPRDRPSHAPDPDCFICAGCGFLPCQPQDLSVLRVSGRCSTCKHPSFYLVAATHGWAEVPDSRHHYEVELDEDHPAGYEPAPLVDAIADELKRETGR